MRALLPLVILASACRSECLDIFEPIERDWCYVRQAGASSRDGNYSRSRRLLAEVKSPSAKAAGVEWMLTVAERPLTGDEARAVCRELSEPYDLRCTQTWAEASPAWAR